MSAIALPPPYCNNEEDSFAFVTCEKRWPSILKNTASDLLETAKGCYDLKKGEEAIKIHSKIMEFREEIIRNDKLSPLSGEGNYVDTYNNDEVIKSKREWKVAPWLFTECYFYRRLIQIFHESEHWTDFDPFWKSKNSAFKSTEVSMKKLVQDLANEMEKWKSEDSSPKATQSSTKMMFNAAVSWMIGKPPNQQHFQDELKTNLVSLIARTTKLIQQRTFLMESLWANYFDLSLLENLSAEQLSNVLKNMVSRELNSRIIVNHFENLWLKLQEIKEKSTKRQIDIVLDNAGFEVFADLILAIFFIYFEMTDIIVIHPKSLPWMVSDASAQDILEVEKYIESLEDSAAQKVSKLLSKYLSEGKIIIRPNNFWTSPITYRDMKQKCPSLFEDFKESDLVIFKGDLNYRKLTGDLRWHREIPWSIAIGSMSEITTASLRTCKADVCVGLQPGQEMDLDKKDPKWAIEGNHAVLMFHDGKKGLSAAKGSN